MSLTIPTVKTFTATIGGSNLNSGAKLNWQQAQGDIVVNLPRSNNLYTVIMYDESLDPTLTHYLAINVTANKPLKLADKSSNVILEYIPPNPPAGSTHTYIIEVFQQDAHQQPIPVDRHGGISDQGLTFIGELAFLASSREPSRGSASAVSVKRSISTNRNNSGSLTRHSGSTVSDSTRIKRSDVKQFFPELSGSQLDYCSCVAKVEERNLEHPDRYYNPYAICGHIEHEKGVCGRNMRINEMPLELLQAEANLYKLDTTGSREDLLARLSAYKQART